jgi:hypothetical protein
LVDKTPAELDPGTPSDTSLVHASENGVSTNSKGHDERDISRLQGTSPLYSSSKTYNVNDLVTESGIVYRCINSIAVPESFNLSNWTEISTAGSDFRLRFTSKRQMTLHFGTGIIPSSDGLGANLITIEGDQTAILDVDGYYIQKSTKGGMAPEPSGFIVTDSTRRDLNFDVTIKFRMDTLIDTAMYLGFFNNDPLTVALSTIQHFALILQSDNANVNFRISHSDGATQGETQVALQDTSIHTIRLVSDESNTRFLYSFDGAALSAVSTNIPASNTNLDLYLEVEDLGGAGDSEWDFWYLDGFCDK